MQWTIRSNLAAKGCLPINYAQPFTVVNFFLRCSIGSWERVDKQQSLAYEIITF